MTARAHSPRWIRRICACGHLYVPHCHDTGPEDTACSGTRERALFGRAVLSVPCDCPRWQPRRITWRRP